MTIKVQNNKFDRLWNALMFNIYTGTPDSIILPFLKNHFPYLAKSPEPGGWTIYPPGPIKIPQHGMHSLRVDHHPFIRTKQIGTRIDLLTQEWMEGPPGIERTRIWIYFDSQALAKSAYNGIIDEFRNIGAHVAVFKFTNQEKVIIKRGPGEEQWESLTIILKKKPTANKYSIRVLFFDDKGDVW